VRLPPDRFLQQVVEGPGLCIAEEHVRHGGFGAAIALQLTAAGHAPKKFAHLHATAHQFDRYGSQHYLRRQSRLDVERLLASVGLG
jgi:transketolase